MWIPAGRWSSVVKACFSSPLWSVYLCMQSSYHSCSWYFISFQGGSVSAGMAIYDTMQYVPCDVSTVWCVQCESNCPLLITIFWLAHFCFLFFHSFGMAASMGAFLLGAGAKGKRRALPNSRIMIHQPLGGAQGQAADIEIQVRLETMYYIQFCDGSF